MGSCNFNLCFILLNCRRQPDEATKGLSRCSRMTSNYLCKCQSGKDRGESVHVLGCTIDASWEIWARSLAPLMGSCNFNLCFILLNCRRQPDEATKGLSRCSRMTSNYLCKCQSGKDRGESVHIYIYIYIYIYIEKYDHRRQWRYKPTAIKYRSPQLRLRCAHKRDYTYIPVVPHKAVAEVSKIGNL